MTFAELKAELLNRGFNYLDQNDPLRSGRFINWAMHELDDAYLWPYREATATGAAPLTIADLGIVEMVTDSTGYPLEPLEYRDVVYSWGDPTQAGVAFGWYERNGQVLAFPATGTITVKYWKVTPDLSAAGDIPLSPTRFHGLIVDLAVRRAYRDSDNASLADDLNAQIDADLQKMANALFVKQTQQGSLSISMSHPRDY